MLHIGSMGTNKYRYYNEQNCLTTVAQLDLNNHILGLSPAWDLVSFTFLLVFFCFHYNQLSCQHYFYVPFYSIDFLHRTRLSKDSDSINT